MPQVQFKGPKALFTGGKADFCPDHCTCTDPTGPTDPVDPTNSCTDCKSARACVYCRDCTPTTLRLTFAGTSERTSCVECGTGGSIKVTTGSLTGVYDLIQTEGNSCHWVFTDDSPTMVATGYIGAACTSTATVSTKLIITATRDSTGLEIHAILRIFANGTSADFIVSTGRYTLDSPLNLPNTFVVNATDSSDASRCDGWQQGLGGNLGWGGTASVLVCPTSPHYCSCHDDYTCLVASGIVIPAGVADFNYPDCIDDEAPTPAACTKTAVEVPFNITCEWITGTVAAGGVDNLKVKIHWYNEGDEHAVNGCGYYLYLYAVTGGGDVEKANYYLDSKEPTGTYGFVDSLIEGMPQFIEVSDTCAVPPVDPCLSPVDDDLPSAVSVNFHFNGRFYIDGPYAVTCEAVVVMTKTGVLTYEASDPEHVCSFYDEDGILQWAGFAAVTMVWTDPGDGSPCYWLLDFSDGVGFCDLAFHKEGQDPLGSYTQQTPETGCSCKNACGDSISTLTIT
jgi:hypothetical protein